MIRHRSPGGTRPGTTIPGAQPRQLGLPQPQQVELAAAYGFSQ
ncbi:hypothetical protein ACH4YO_41040 [Streptomyces noursei]